ncbi:MAG TPA: DUF3460 family protein [Burkholderiaceae bacterium]|nr:DUF3460 family protein [Burkholderiaceae bacterium]
MSIFARPHYTSDATDFIESIKSANPALEAGQREGRNLLWDKDIDHSVQKDLLAGQIAQKPYPYQTAPTEA